MEGITPIFLFFSDRIGTLNPIPGPREGSGSLGYITSFMLSQVPSVTIFKAGPKLIISGPSCAWFAVRSSGKSTKRSWQPPV